VHAPTVVHLKTGSGHGEPEVATNEPELANQPEKLTRYIQR
jgi:hypothetical protein